MGRINSCKDKRKTEKGKKTEKVAQKKVVRENTRTYVTRPTCPPCPDAGQFTPPEKWWLNLSSTYADDMAFYREWNKTQEVAK